MNRRHVEVVSVQEMDLLRQELTRVVGAPVEQQMPVIAAGAEMGNAYYRDAHGALRRVFPKGALKQRRRKR